MRAEGIDERQLGRERHGSNFVIFIYEGVDAPNSSWSVDSYLLTDGDLPRVLLWLRENLPADCCWSLGVVQQPLHPTPNSDLEVAWIVGADVLNASRHNLSADERRVADEMLRRRHRTTLP